MDKKQKDDSGYSADDMEYIPVPKGIKENMRVQRTEYIRQQIRQRKEEEDALMLQLAEEQRIIGSLQARIDEDLEQTEETEKYNRELKESMRDKIYSMHGVSRDKVEGIAEYKNAYRRGAAFSFFLLSVALIVLCGVLNGFDSGICLFMLGFTGIEGALLSQEKNGCKILRFLCRFLYFLMLPVMIVMFVCFELKYKEYSLFLPYAVLAGTVILVIGVMSYFLYNPYRSAKKKVREAKIDIANIEKEARKQAAKNQRISSEETKKARKQAERAERMEQKKTKRDSRRKTENDIGLKESGNSKSPFAGEESNHSESFSSQKALEGPNEGSNLISGESLKESPEKSSITLDAAGADGAAESGNRADCSSDNCGQSAANRD